MTFNKTKAGFGQFLGIYGPASAGSGHGLLDFGHGQPIGIGRLLLLEGALKCVK